MTVIFQHIVVIAIFIIFSESGFMWISFVWEIRELIPNVI